MAIGVYFHPESLTAPNTTTRSSDWMRQVRDDLKVDSTIPVSARMAA
jgi:hypothetical protein